MEATLDLLARYTHSNISSAPSRSLDHLFSDPRERECLPHQVIWSRVPLHWWPQQNMVSWKLLGYRNNHRGVGRKSENMCKMCF